MTTILDLQPVPVEVDHAGDETAARVLREAFAEVLDACERRGVSPLARRLLDALTDAVDGAEE